MNKNNLFSLISLFLFIIGAICPVSLSAQISEGGIPSSFQYTNRFKSSLPIRQIPIDFSVEDLKMVDEWQVSQGAPLKVGTFIDTDLSIDNAGHWSSLPNGQKIWQLRIQAKGAIALMVSFKEFYIPEEGKLFIYNAERTHLIGAFTHQTNPSTLEYATEFIAGDDIILEYETNGRANQQPRLSIDRIGYGYNHLSVSPTKEGIGPGSSGSCMVNINCEEGDAWQTEKKGICLITFTINKYIYYCSGSVVNNTAEDLKPYVLSAYHCIDIDSTTVTQKDLNKSVFYFHFEQTGCENSSAAASYKTMVGCKKIAHTPLDGGSDGLLLLLNDSIPESYNVYYNGWDRSNTPATSGVGIHHPSGDYMKISTFKRAATSNTWFSDKTFGASKAHWNVIFNSTANGHSVTEGGSSGSPLFNQKKLIVGTLSGGSSSCKYPEETNYYGKLYYHWDQYSKADTGRMDIYLDPIKSGVTQLAGRYGSTPKEAPTDLVLTYKNQEVQLTWKAPDSEEKPVKYAVYRNNTFIDYSTVTSYSDREPETGTQLYGVSAIYAGDKESPTTNKSIYVYELKPPTEVTAKANGQEVTVRRKAPVFEQMVYWGTGSAYQMISFGRDFYFGQRWEPADLQPLHLNLIRSILFLPTEGSTYSLLIKQGDREYTQKLQKLVYEDINTIELEQPFTIDASKDLIVAFHAIPSKEGVYPAVIDEGPAINGKGNLVSIDGKNWEYYYEPPTDDFNFLLAAVITSEEGELIKTKAVGTAYAPLLLTRSNAQIRSAEMRTEESANPSVRSLQTSAFPEITGYNIYRNEQKIGEISQPSITEYTDKQIPATPISYKVSTLYKDNESPKSEASTEIGVDNEKIPLSEVSIHPISFNQQIHINGHEKVNLLEIISAEGKQMVHKKHPESIIYTNSFPAGLYFFRLHTDQGIQIIKGIKNR